MRWGGVIVLMSACLGDDEFLPRSEAELEEIFKDEDEIVENSTKLRLLAGREAFFLGQNKKAAASIETTAKRTEEAEVARKLSKLKAFVSQSKVKGVKKLEKIVSRMNSRDMQGIKAMVDNMDVKEFRDIGDRFEQQQMRLVPDDGPKRAAMAHMNAPRPGPKLAPGVLLDVSDIEDRALSEEIAMNRTICFCLAASIRRAGVSKQGTVTAIAQLGDSRQTLQDLQNVELVRMVGICLLESTSDDYEQFKAGMLEKLPVLMVQRAAKADTGPRMVAEIKGDRWNVLQEIAGTIVPIQQNNTWYFWICLVLVVLLFIAGYLATRLPKVRIQEPDQRPPIKRKDRNTRKNK